MATPKTCSTMYTLATAGEKRDLLSSFLLIELVIIYKIWREYTVSNQVEVFVHWYFHEKSWHGETN